MILRILHSLLLLFYSLRVWHARAVLVNRTIDDTLGDSVTGARPMFLPDDPGVWEDQTCGDCRVKADKALAFKGTWTSASYKGPDGTPISIRMNFTGTAIYVFLIIANIKTDTACNFTLDGRHVGSFLHSPSSHHDRFQYNVAAYTGLNLPNIDHNLTISASGRDRHLYVSFDYAIYTADEPQTASIQPTTSIPPSMPSATTTVGQVVPIAGGVSGGLTVLAASLALFFLCRRGRRGKVVMVTTPDAIQPALENPPSESLTNDSSPNGYRNVPSTDDGVPNDSESRDAGGQLTVTTVVPGETVLAPQRMGQQDDASRPTRTQQVYTLRSTNLDPEVREQLRRERQAELDQQLQNLLREMQELNKDRKLEEGTPGSPSSYAPLSPPQTRQREQEIAVMREQMQQMRAHIEYLQVQQNSEWAQGLSDEPPPGYSVRVSRILRE
ncbi:hypothetical protein D9615_001533 [Tricholomella constricta]|uniref:Uncharacterized protein n=1 Tax=Tricholomella constricta TaxID=117010 RepID=A0A8H5HPF8_9AGAR|nr:hypothetical protein D9615_001533 [Tricholomella constricta]